MLLVIYHKTLAKLANDESRYIEAGWHFVFFFVLVELQIQYPEVLFWTTLKCDNLLLTWEPTKKLL